MASQVHPIEKTYNWTAVPRCIFFKADSPICPYECSLVFERFF